MTDDERIEGEKMKPETREETSNINQNQDQIQTEDRKLLRPKTRETTDQMVTTMNNQDVHDEILLRRKAGALSDGPLQKHAAS